MLVGLADCGIDVDRLSVVKGSGVFVGLCPRKSISSPESSEHVTKETPDSLPGGVPPCFTSL